MNPTHLINKKTGQTFVYTERLSEHRDLLPHSLGKPAAKPVEPIETTADADAINAFDDKGELIEFAKGQYGVKLDSRRSLENLKLELIETAEQQ